MSCPRLLAATALVALSSAPAAADYTPVAPVRPLTMSDPSGLSAIGLDFQLTKWTEHPPLLNVDFTSVTLDVAADIKLAPHWMILARLPVSHVSIDGDPINPDCCDFALGNVTLGGRGLWATLFDSGSRAVVGGELSFSIPTASDGGSRAISAGTAAFAQAPHDPGRYAPNTTTVRLTTLAQFYSRWFLLHGEVGMQLYFYDGDAPGNDSSDIGIRLALAAGIRATYKVAILGELSSMLFYSNKFTGSDSATSLDLGVRYGSGGGFFGLRFYLPVNQELRDVDMFGVGLDAGLRF